MKKINIVDSLELLYREFCTRENFAEFASRGSDDRRVVRVS